MVADCPMNDPCAAFKTPHGNIIPSSLQGVRKIIAIACILSAMAVAVLDAASANVALTTIASQLHIAPAQAVWVVTAYQTALIMALLPSAAIGERFGYRPVFMAGLWLFVIAAGLCTFATSLVWLVIGRSLKGIGAAAIMALGVALLRFTVKPGQLRNAIGWNALTVALCTAIGPAFGAAMLSQFDWQYLFAATVPLAILALCASLALPEVARVPKPIDAFGMAAYAAIIAAFVMAAEILHSEPVFGIMLAAIAATSATGFIRRERMRTVPFLPIDLFHSMRLRKSVIASVFCFTGQAMAFVALPFYLHHNLGQTLLIVGLLMTPWPLTIALTIPLTARLTNHLDTALLCAAGGICLAIGLSSLAVYPEPVPLPVLIASLMACGLGFGLFQVPNNSNMFLSAPADRAAAVGGVQGTARLSGQTMGAVIMTLIFVLLPTMAAPKFGFGIAAAMTLTAGLVSMKRTS